MGIKELQAFIEMPSSGGTVPVDLLRIARNKKPPQPGRKLKLVLDAECCLDRLYGGFFSDWASGGQWNRMMQFLVILVKTLHTNGIELVVFFNGCLETNRLPSWAGEQAALRHNVAQVLRHLGGKGTPPPKVWWVPPVCLRTILRMALRHLNVAVMCSMDDHRQEVIAYCRENNFHGLLVEDAEYAAFNPPRYFSSEHLKLTYKGSLETKEYMLPKVAETLDLPSSRLPLLAALLGNHALSDEDLHEFHRGLCTESPTGKPIPCDVLIRGLAGFIKGLGAAADDVEQVVGQVFPAKDPRAVRLRTCIQYYLNGTKEGFLRYHTARSSKQPHRGSKGKGKPALNQATQDTLRFASETAESERDSLAAYKEATSKSSQLAPEIVVEPPGPVGEISQDSSGGTTAVNGNLGGLQLSTSSSSSNSSAASPCHAPTGSGDQGWQTPRPEEKQLEARMAKLVSPEILRTACERHQKGLMSPNIYQILVQGEVKLGTILEDEHHKELPSAYGFFRPVRQMVYGILFNLHHHTYIQSHPNKTETNPQNNKPQPPPVELSSIVVREWVWSRNNPYATPELVKAELVGWGVPTIQRLWFGSTIDDKRRRLRAFLSCMRSDNSLMLNPSCVPQPMLVLACVLRYMMSFPDKRILHKHELDALIAQAFAPEIQNATYLQELQLPRLSQRGVQLASLVMAGVEMALMANDACGAPIPWLMCCPWLFFDGKLFQHKLLKAESVKNLLELCDHRIEAVMKVERMREAILEGLQPQFARMPLMPLSAVTQGVRSTMPTVSLMPTGAPLLPLRTAAGRGTATVRQRQVLARGGQLEIAGVVVGSWGPNYGSGLTRGGGGNVNRGNGSQNSKNPRQTGLPPPAGCNTSLLGNSPGWPRGVTKMGNRTSNLGRGHQGTNRRNRGAKKSGDKELKSRGPTVQLPNGTTVTASELLQNGGLTNSAAHLNNSHPAAPLVKKMGIPTGQFDDAEICTSPANISSQETGATVGAGTVGKAAGAGTGKAQ